VALLYDLRQYSPNRRGFRNCDAISGLYA